MRKQILAALLLAGFSMFGCATLNKSHETQNAAVASLHADYNAGRFDQIWLGAHPRFQAEVNREKFVAYLASVHARLGGVVSTANVERRASTANAVTTVFLVQRTAFEKGRGTETLTVRMEGDERAVLVSYNVQSPLLDAR